MPLPADEAGEVEVEFGLNGSIDLKGEIIGSAIDKE